ncbi:hypothetical protein K502DRAFT_324709 [Neoconidiobolus thromboides FSU 785]|nr:hypothetical protein K502DRAFT_324709 [Neoconidiobolus thromboides FSU 785]
MFGRTANGDGTNTYSFSCRCTADSNKSTVQTYCDYRGSEIKSNCSGNPLKSPDNELSLQIANCTNGMALVSLKFKDGSSKTANFPLYCIGVGIAGLDCNGSATV